MPTLFLTKASKIHNGEKKNVAGKSGYLPAKNLNYIPVYHRVLASTQNESRPLISDMKL
jgi:hypothetical protein